MPDLSLEQEEKELAIADGIENPIIAGCDEAGRGPFAGPLVAAAVILPVDVSLPGVTDSKKVPKHLHQCYAKKILEQALAVGIGVADVTYIDRFGIGMANRYAIESAVKNLRITPSRLLIDGSSQQEIHTTLPQRQVVKGDQRSLSIAAASIIAKSVHDELMDQCDKEYPEYGWKKNAGYGTPEHLKAIETYGICKYHRRSFRPVKTYLKQEGAKERL